MPSPRRSGGAPPSSFRVNFDPYRTEVPALNNSGNATSDPFSSTMHTGSYYNLTLWNQNREEDQRSFLFMRDGGEAPRFRRPKTVERSTGSYQKSKLSQCTSIDDTCSERGQCGGSRFSDSNEADVVYVFTNQSPILHALSVKFLMSKPEMGSPLASKGVFTEAVTCPSLDGGTMFKHRYPDHRTQYHFINSIPYNMPFKTLLTSVDDPIDAVSGGHSPACIANLPSLDHSIGLRPRENATLWTWLMRTKRAK
ncbi:uncharacterized protein ARMOST_02385 [Armillaria ostoyae]|uniref:Uncharacterized protein n=1 Tax=Armillaria ostoyae TaxID=47428 RepID=A0A284QRI9_ARMOS|nr:uncharacterized protein ARMOST_02385 [Armillaria ostoyae]